MPPSQNHQQAMPKNINRSNTSQSSTTNGAVVDGDSFITPTTTTINTTPSLYSLFLRSCPRPNHQNNLNINTLPPPPTLPPRSTIAGVSNHHRSTSVSASNKRQALLDLLDKAIALEKDFVRTTTTSTTATTHNNVLAATTSSAGGSLERQ